MTDAEAPPDETATDRQRLDRWLWCARFFKSRALAAAFCNAGQLRLSSRKIEKASQPLRPGDVLTFPLGPHIRVIRVARLAERRGPPAEARGLYEDLAPPPARAAVPEPGPARRDPGAGRPTKAERRSIERFTDYDPEKQ